MTNLARVLREFGDADTFPILPVASRWGEIMREDPDVTSLLDEARERGRLTRLDSVAKVSGGVVTRANAYFVLRELPLVEVPEHLNVTRHDLSRIAVVVDGLQTIHKIERQFLRPVVKGPEMLLGPARVPETDLRLFDVRVSKEELRRERCYYALAYIERGEAQNYRKSADSLKGGVPAKRSNIKNRRPFWYSLSVPSNEEPRLVVPEHIDSRYLVTTLGNASAVVLDKLFVVRPNREIDTEVLLAALNSILAWYIMELRGRTQLGQGVLEVKKADLEGLLVIDPTSLTSDERKKLIEAFVTIRSRDSLGARAEVLAEDRQGFEEFYMELLIGRQRAEARRLVERAWRNLREERIQKPRSLEEARTARGKTVRSYQDPESWVDRIIESIDSLPDPRSYLEDGRKLTTKIAIAKVRSYDEVTVRHDLFAKGEVMVGGQVVAQSGSKAVADFVRSVLIFLGSVGETQVPEWLELPADDVVERALARWEPAVKRWRRNLEERLNDICSVMTDARLAKEVRRRTLQKLNIENLDIERIGE